MEPKNSPDWWEEFCEAVAAQVLWRYECKNKTWVETAEWVPAIDWVTELCGIERDEWHFRKRINVVKIEVNGDLVGFAGPEMAGQVLPRSLLVCGISGNTGRADSFLPDALVFRSEVHRETIVRALLGLTP